MYPKGHYYEYIDVKYLAGIKYSQKPASLGFCGPKVEINCEKNYDVVTDNKMD